MFFDHRNGCGAVTGFGDDLDIEFHLQQMPERLPEKDMVVSE
jgi:hypothetical protein